MDTNFSTQELALAAFLKAHDHQATLDAADSSGFVTFLFDDPNGRVRELAAGFLTGAPAPALPYFHALNELRAAIRFARGGGR